MFRHLSLVLAVLASSPALASRPHHRHATKQLTAVRHFQVFKGEVLVLEIADTPGPLISTAAPPPPPGAKLARHPFLSASAYVATEEDRLRRLLDASHSTDEYLDKLRAADYRVVELAPK